jgi:hypothetical protein
VYRSGLSVDMLPVMPTMPILNARFPAAAEALSAIPSVPDVLSEGNPSIKNAKKIAAKTVVLVARALFPSIEFLSFLS